MSYTPSATAQAIAALIASNLANAGSPGPWPGLQNGISGSGSPQISPIPLEAQIDAYLSSFAIPPSRDASATIAGFTTPSTSFVPIGDGTTTGFRTYTFSAPVAKPYLVNVDLSCYCSGLGAGAGFQLQLANTTTSQNFSDAATLFEVNIAGQVQHYGFRFQVPMNAGNNVLQLQARALTGCTFAVDTLCFRCFTVQG
jgi:hypothetical protein